MPQTPITDNLQQEQRKKLLNRLARVEGQLRAIQRLIEQGEPCELVAQQMSAARGGLQRAFVEMIACALEHRVGTGGRDVDPAEHERVTELVGLLAKYS